MTSLRDLFVTVSVLACGVIYGKDVFLRRSFSVRPWL